MEQLPFWRLTKGHPAFYDSESATAIEMVAKIYGAMNSLITEYNEIVKVLNDKNKALENDMNESHKLHVVEVGQMFQDFIDTVDIKMRKIQKYCEEFQTDFESDLGIDYQNFTNSINEQMSAFKLEMQEQYDNFLATDEGIRDEVDVFKTDTTNTLNQALSDLETYKTNTTDDLTAFKEDIQKEVDDAVSYMETNLNTTVTNIINTKIENDEIKFGMAYDETSESLVMSVSSADDTKIDVVYDEETETITFS